MTEGEKVLMASLGIEVHNQDVSAQVDNRAVSNVDALKRSQTASRSTCRLKTHDDERSGMLQQERRVALR